MILLLVNADFIRSDYCSGKELARALERHRDPADRAVVIPVILRRCDWEGTPFARLQALPRDGKPLSDWETADDFYTAVAKGLRGHIRGLSAPAGAPPGGGAPIPMSPAPVSTPALRQLPERPWWRHPSLILGLAAFLALIGLAVGGWWQATAEVGR